MFGFHLKGLGGRGALLICLAVAAAGCSEQGSGVDLTPVAGTVMLDGKPLGDARLAFYPTGTAVPGYSGSVGETNSEGKYEISAGSQPGAVPGEYKVTISRVVASSGAVVNLEEGMDMEQLLMQGEAEESLPEKYSSYEKTELNVSIEKGKADGYDFQLTSS